MSDPTPILWLIPIFPLIGFLLAGLLGPRLLRQYSHWPCIVGALCAAILSLLVLSWAIHQPRALFPSIQILYTWFHAGNVDLDLVIGRRIDGVSRRAFTFGVTLRR